DAAAGEEIGERRAGRAGADDHDLGHGRLLAPRARRRHPRLDGAPPPREGRAIARWSIQQRLARLDWEAIARNLDERGHATPLLLRYTAGGYNCLHQDLYGALAFPLQVTCVLGRRGADYTGGEILLVEQRPRAQSRGSVIVLERGAAVVFPNRYRPVAGARGAYRATLRHGVSR